ncbi:MAG: metallophosphoesterase family protein [Hyphomicrobiaceae bacterium]
MPQWSSSVTANLTLLRTTGPVLVFGGPYSNVHATLAVLTAARGLGIAPDHVVCTGDLVAYCGSPLETVDLVRASGIRVVMGNCDEQIATDADDCGCGFTTGSQCDRLSAAWFAFARSKFDDERRQWLGRLPKAMIIEIGDARLRVIHGSVSRINEFVFATTAGDRKRDELALADADGVIGGHCGLPFSEVVDGKLWHNAGVVGMPANDGTPRVWYSVLRAARRGISIEHCALSYDHMSAARAMLDCGLPAEYRRSLETGLWPSCDVLPGTETRVQGAALAPARVSWAPGGSDSAVLWPDLALLEASPRAACCAET